MSIWCTLLGHKWGPYKLGDEQRQHEDYTEVVFLTYRECKRCGEREVKKERKEVVEHDETVTQDKQEEDEIEGGKVEDTEGVEILTEISEEGTEGTDGEMGDGEVLPGEVEEVEPEEGKVEAEIENTESAEVTGEGEAEEEVQEDKKELLRKAIDESTGPDVVRTDSGKTDYSTEESVKGVKEERVSNESFKDMESVAKGTEPENKETEQSESEDEPGEKVEEPTPETEVESGVHDEAGGESEDDAEIISSDSKETGHERKSKGVTDGNNRQKEPDDKITKSERDIVSFDSGPDRYVCTSCDSKFSTESAFRDGDICPLCRSGYISSGD